jgi:hypothetical protein
MNRFKKITPEAVYRYLPQFFIGLFFLSAAYLKATEGLFGDFRSPLGAILQHWMNGGLTPDFYKPLVYLMMPYGDSIAIIVILMQGIAGILLIINRQTRLAGLLLFFVQLNVYFATYYQLELRVLNSQAMLMGVYYFARGDMKGRMWGAFTYALVVVGLMHLAGRVILFHDELLTSFQWQRNHFAAYVMSSWPGLKYFVLWATSGKFGALMWTSFWWIKLCLILGMLSRYRFYAGLGWLVMSFLITLVWLSAFSCEGVFWVLTMFLWVTHEYTLERSTSKPPTSFLP